MKKDLELLYLFDIYGEFLTIRQREVISGYYGCDLSLTELSQSLFITRQAVNDALKKGKKILYDFEEKLKLMQIKKRLNNALQLSEQELKKEINDLLQSI